MLNYFRRLLKPPNVVHYFAFFATLALAGVVTGFFLYVAGPFAFLLATMSLFYLLWLMLGSCMASTFIAVCEEIVVLAVIFSSSRTDDNLTWPVIGAIASVLALAVLAERMDREEE